MKLWLLDRDSLAAVAEIDESDSTFVVTRSLYGTATFTLTIGRRANYALLITPGTSLIYAPDGTHNLIYLVETKEETEDGSSVDLLTYTGRGIDGMAIAERLAYPASGQAYDTQNSPAETMMKHYVSANAGATAAAARQIPNLTIAADAGRGATFRCDARYQYVLDVLQQIGQNAGIGWEIVFDPVHNQFVFDVIVGTDRSSTVYLDFALDSLAQWHQLQTLVGMKTDVLVGGQGTGTAMDLVERPGSPPTGWARRESFLSDTGVAYGATSTLSSDGDAFLAANGLQQSLDATARQLGSFQYERDYDMGDIVTVRNLERDISYTARIIIVKVTYAGGKVPVIEVTLGRPFPGDPGQLNSFSSSKTDIVSVSSIPANSLPLADLAQIAAHTLLANNTAGLGNVTAIASAAAGAGANIAIDSAGASGVADTFAPAAHGHDLVTTDAPSGANITVDTAASVAATGAVARAAHGHRLNTYASTPPDTDATVASAGTSGAAPARGDHRHHGHGQSHDHSAVGDNTALAPVSVTATGVITGAGVKLGKAPAQFVCSSPLTTSTAYQDVAGCTTGAVVSAVAEYALVIGVFSAASTATSGTFYGALNVDGAVVAGVAQYNVNAIWQPPAAVFIWIVPLTAASHTLKLQAKDGTNPFTVNATNTAMTVIRFAQ